MAYELADKQWTKQVKRKRNNKTGPTKRARTSNDHTSGESSGHTTTGTPDESPPGIESPTETHTSTSTHHDTQTTQPMSSTPTASSPTIQMPHNSQEMDNQSQLPDSSQTNPIKVRDRICLLIPKRATTDRLESFDDSTDIAAYATVESIGGNYTFQNQHFSGGCYLQVRLGQVFAKRYRPSLFLTKTLGHYGNKTIVWEMASCGRCSNDQTPR